MDILTEMNDEDLTFVIETLNQNIPYNIKDLYYILSAKKCKEALNASSNISNRVVPKFYSPRDGLKKNCTVFGITGPTDHTVWFFTLEESLREVKECLENSKLIRWNEGVLFVTLHKNFTTPILEIIQIHKYNMREHEPASYFWLPKEKAQALKPQ